MKSEPTHPVLINVIIPVYNNKPTLERAVNSVLAQTLNDFQLTMVNDASSDDSLDLAKELAKKDERIKVLEHPANRGTSAARNTGIAACRSKYLGFLDADDSYEPDFLLTLTRLLEENPYIDCVKAGVNLPQDIDELRYMTIRNSLITNGIIRRCVMLFIGGFPEGDAFRAGCGGEDIAINHLLKSPFNVTNIEEKLYNHIPTKETSATDKFLGRTKVVDNRVEFKDVQEIEKEISSQINVLIAKKEMKLRYLACRVGEQYEDGP
jgi:glycosyltransferase involved in cell wall biosynthesis